ncbi:serine hydrolase domain-containing protein [Pseudoduganella violaceinigra]|uniref:serine hydrolase domain-containing protein n=1 Tax=Pseudoduganella violaceinigra TaxID=246602 RepID=UPI00041F6CC0|nr:serine hydrolase domain-containing protein [Pseudoduganella violaceinigra]
MALVVVLLAGSALAAPLDRPLSQKMQANAQRYVIASQAVLVARNGVSIYRHVAGARRDELFPLYSLSKLLASVLVMQLVENGSLDLDKPAASYVQGLPQHWQAIPLRHFLNHTSGLPEYFDLGGKNTGSFPPTLQAAFDALASQPLVFDTGSSTRYTQTNFLVLEAVLEAQYGQPYTQIARERIIDRLGLKHSFLGLANASRQEMVRSFIGKDGRLQDDPPVQWPEYANVHAQLFMSLDDLAAFLHAVARGDLVGKEMLRKLWLPQKLNNGQDGGFASGWEFGRSGGYAFVGHDGGTKVRVRLLWPEQGDGDTYTIVYLTNGSASNVWSRTLVESLMAAIDPARFRMEAISESLIGYATQPDAAGREALLRQLQADAARDGAALERRINETGYAMLETRGSATAVKIFELNTQLFPQSANARDSLAQAQARAAAKSP